MNAVISMTTIPSRLVYMHLSVMSLARQGLPVYVWLPHHVERLGEGFDAVPAFLEIPGVHAEIVEDQGPATKLLPALERFEVIITADDDHLYGPGWAEGLLAWAERRPGAALGYRGRRFAEGLNYKRSRKVINPQKPARVDLLTGVHGALYRREFFEAGFACAWEQWPSNDDIVIGGYLKRREIPMLVIPRRCKIKSTKACRIDPLTAVNVQAGLNEAGLREIYEERNRAG